MNCKTLTRCGLKPFIHAGFKTNGKENIIKRGVLKPPPKMTFKQQPKQSSATSDCGLKPFIHAGLSTKGKKARRSIVHFSINSLYTHEEPSYFISFNKKTLYPCGFPAAISHC